jgi:hypothetical protein
MHNRIKAHINAMLSIPQYLKDSFEYHLLLLKTPHWLV